jgi:two-component system phosphate regulon sensor histidine kinase PhoR
MNTFPKKSRPLFWFYILVAYVLIQFFWWGYLMVSLNNEIFYLKTELNLLKGESAEDVILKGNELNQKLHKRWIMICGEGVVFMGVLAIGIFQTRKTFKKEEELSLLQQNFLLSVTHELKSPIASTKLQLQTLQRHDLNREKQKEIIANAINDTERLNNLVENILLAAKIENNVFLLHREDFNLSEYLAAGIRQTIQSFNYKQKIIVEIEPDIYFNIDRTTFPSIVLNLIENAVKYSPSDSAIVVSLKKQKQKIIFSVSDEGLGISEKDKEVIFQKFYRVGNEETRKTTGTGLGLYIVDFLVKQHGGTIKVKNNQSKGSIFEVSFDAE